MQAYASRRTAVKSVDDRDNSISAAHCTSAHRAHSDDPLIADHPLQRVEAAKIVVSVCSLDNGHQSIANADVVCKHLAGLIQIDRFRDPLRSEEHMYESQSLMRISYAVLCSIKTYLRHHLS